ncbi:MAG TPA: DUF924 family protein [Rhodocyclaceae bacterium]|nr:DUF924 family protein [Rhodocyclaceae bacterium]
MDTPETVHAFWFGPLADDAAVARAQARQWWKKDARTDALMRERFAALVTGAATGTLDDWLTRPAGRLALILLTDQFPRNMYRGTPRSFAYDRLARAWCVAGLERGDDRSLRPIERVFFYLPLEHSESLDDQQRSVALFATLADEAPAAHRAVFDDYLAYALRHRDIVARFGRFPHRNGILGRTSTAQEHAFLGKRGSSF